MISPQSVIQQNNYTISTLKERNRVINFLSEKFPDLLLDDITSSSRKYYSKEAHKFMKLISLHKENYNGKTVIIVSPYFEVDVPDYDAVLIKGTSFIVGTIGNEEKLELYNWKNSALDEGYTNNFILFIEKQIQSLTKADLDTLNSANIRVNTDVK